MKDIKTTQRILASLVDLVVVLAILALVNIRSLVAFIDTVVNPTNISIITLLLSGFVCGSISIILVLLYLVALPIYWKGQTLGKRFFHLRLIKNDGSDADFKTLFIREIIRIFLAIISLGVSIFVNYLVIWLSKNHLSFHDVVSSTHIVDMIEE